MLVDVSETSQLMNASEAGEQSPGLLFLLHINLEGSLQAEIRTCRDNRTVSVGADARVERGSNYSTYVLHL